MAIIRQIVFSVLLIIITSITVVAEDAKQEKAKETKAGTAADSSQVSAEDKEKKEEKRRRNPIVDTFTRIDQGENGINVLVIFADKPYFVYKGILDEANKKYNLDKFHVFFITINSQRKEDLSNIKFEDAIYLRNQAGVEYKAVKQWIPISEGPNKKTGMIRFFRVDANGKNLFNESDKHFEIIVKNLGDIPERLFKWELPIEF